VTKTIAVIRGDGIGPEIMAATLKVLDALECGLEYDFVEAGMVALEKHGELLPQATLDVIAKHGVALKGPLTTPIGKGFSSLNVALRLRENTEGAYLSEGQTLSDDGETGQSIVRNTRKGASRIVRHAFDLAVRKGRRKVTAVHKANIIKTASGLFLDVAREIAQEYPAIEFNEMIVDNTCMQLVMNPWQFDVIVTTNLFGDILSDLCAGLVGGLGLAPGANIGNGAAIFEAVHGSAPDIAGRSVADPCALLLAAAEMLDHLDMTARATRIREAIRAALEAHDRVTPDLGGSGTTESFAEALVERVRV